MSKARVNVNKLNDIASVRDFGAIGNGVTDDTVAIQVALDSGAKVIWFPPGTYRITSALAPVSNQQLTGFGATLTTDNLNFTNAIEITGCTNVVVQDLTIAGPSGGDGFDMAIRIRDSSNVTVKNTLIQNIGRDVPMPNEKGFGILIQGASNSGPVPGGNGCFNINVIDNTILDIKGFGDFRGDAVAMTNARGVYVSGNTMGRCRRMTVSATDYATDVQISDNEIFDSYLCGIDIEPNFGPSETGEIIIANNIIRNFGIKPAGYVGVQFFGIDLHSGEFENVIVNGNIVIAESAQAVSGIHAQNDSRNAIISNNIIVGNGYIENGIFLYAGNGFRNLVISNNIIQDFTVNGIESFANDVINISNNFFKTESCTHAIKINDVNVSALIEGNSIEITASCTDAIRVSYVAKSIIASNSLFVEAGVGISLIGSNANEAVSLVSNTIKGGAAMTDGVVLYSGTLGYDSVNATGNTISAFTDTGIHAFANNNVIVSNNLFIASTCVSPIRFVGVVNSGVITGNVIKVTTSCTQAIFAIGVKKLIASNNAITVASGNGAQLTVGGAGNFYYTYTNNSYEKTGATGGDAINLSGNIGSLFFVLGGNVALNASNAIARSGSIVPLDDAWPPIVPTETAANIAAVGNAINTVGKYTGKQVWDTTNNRMMRARGAFAASSWDVIDGSASVTPS